MNRTGSILALLWIALTGLCLTFSGSIFVLAWWLSNVWIGLIVSILLLALLGFYVFKTSIAQVPQNEEWRITLFGNDIGVPWKSGLHFLFPLFCQIRGKAYLGTQRILLILGKGGEEKDWEKEIAEFDGHLEFKGLLEFTDCSAGALLTIFFRITESFKAIYNVDYLYQSVADVVDGAIRSTLAGLAVDKASEKISAEIKKEVQEKIKELLDNWGVEIFDLKLDIVLPEEVMKERRKKLSAERDAEVVQISAEAKAVAITTLAEAEKTARQLQGTGRSLEVNEVKKTGLSVQDSAEHIRRLDFVEKLPERTLILGSDAENVTGLGAKIGAGAIAAQQAAQQKEKERGDE